MNEPCPTCGADVYSRWSIRLVLPPHDQAAERGRFTFDCQKCNTAWDEGDREHLRLTVRRSEPREIVDGMVIATYDQETGELRHNE